MKTRITVGLFGLMALAAAACGGSPDNTGGNGSSSGGSSSGGSSGGSSSGGSSGSSSGGSSGSSSGSTDGGPVDTGGGTTIVFAATLVPNAPAQIYSVHTDGSKLTPLTTATSSALPTGANDAPSFSPDGSVVLFDSGRDMIVGDSGYVTNPTLRMLYTMKPDGSNAKRLTTNDPTHCSERNGRFSHDGQWVTFALTCDNTPNANLDQVYRIKADGTGQAALVTPAMSGVGSASQEAPVFSSDDAKVFFVSDGGTTASQIYAVDVASAAVTQITHLSSTAMLPGTPIATSKGRLYFATMAGPAGGSGPPSLQSIGVDGSDQQTLFAIPTLPGGASVPTQSDFALSPDEARLVFVAITSPTDGGGAIVTSNLAGGDVRTLTPGVLYNATGPAWH